MSTRYAYVWRREWRGTLKGLSKDEKLVLLALRTGPLSTSIPGLVEADVHMLTSVTELSVAEVEAALAGLVEKKRIAVDAGHCMVRVFGLPDPEEPPAPVRSWKTLQGWWSCWCEHPDSPLKYEHIAALRACCDLDAPAKDGQPSMAEIWAQTFAKVATITRGLDTPSDTPSKGGIDAASGGPSDASVQRTAGSDDGFSRAGAGARVWGKAGFETAWHGTLRKSPGAGHLWERLAERIATDAASLEPARDPNEYARSLIGALPLFITWCKENGWSAPALSVASFERHLERLEDWVAGIKPTGKGSGGELPARAPRAATSAPTAAETADDEELERHVRVLQGGGGR